MNPIRHRLISLVFCVLLAACGTQTINPVTGESERTVMSEADEIEAGHKAHAEVLKEYGALDNPRLQAYVNDLGQKLAKQSHRAHLQWTFTVLDSPEVNAFALPGGYVYVTRGIMAYLDSEAELAGVIGHEIGHVTARHSAARATRQQRAGVGVFAASILGAVLEAKGYSGAGNLASGVSQNVAAGYLASYSREQELQADQLGAEYLARNHYDPQNMVDVIDVLKNQERFAADAARAEGRTAPAGANWLSSHPSSDLRLNEIRTIAAKYRGSYGDNGRERYQQAIQGIVFGESAEQGVTRGRNFYHSELGIALTAPADWRIANSANAIAIINRAGDAALLIKLVAGDAGKTHEEILRNALKPVSGKTQSRQINGLAATHFDGVIRNAKGQSDNARLTLITGPGQRHYVLQYLARDAAALERNKERYVEAESSFRTLSADERKQAQPWRLGIAPFPKGGFTELAKTSPLTPLAEQQLRLINGAYDGTAPRPGQMVKIVR